MKKMLKVVLIASMLSIVGVISHADHGMNLKKREWNMQP